MENSLIFPRHLSIQTTSFCNANCIFCPNNEVKHLFPPKVMDEALYKKVIDECKTYRQIERVILYLNNEPLTDAHIIDRINYAKETLPWASVHILTNGSLLDDNMQDKLIESKLDWIGISMHGIKKQSVESAMGLDYDVVFPRVLNFIQKARKKRGFDNFVMVTFLKHKYMAPEESNEVISFWKSQGISRISFFEAPISRAGNVSSIAQTHHSRIFGCRSIWANEMIHIVENGEVILCCMDWRREVILGNVNNQSIHEIWNSQKYARVRDKRDGKNDSEDNFICKRCEESIDQQGNSTVSLKHDLLTDEIADGAIVKNDPVSIALVMVPPWQTKMPPLGLAYLSSFLRASGIKTRVIDLNVKLFNKAEEEKKYFWDIVTINNFTPSQLGGCFCAGFSGQINNFINEIVNSQEAIVGLSTTIASLNVAVYIAHQIKLKNPSKIVILGGPGVFWDTQIIDPERLIDIFVIGEGELPILEIIRRFEKNQTVESLIGIPGTIVQLGGKYHAFAAPNPLKDIDEIPLVDFSGFDLSQYNINSEYRPLPVLISRGCINRCSFCIDHKINAPFRFRSPQKVFDELKYYIQKFAVHDFEFNDLLCNGNLRQLESICDLIIKERLGTRWHSYAAIRTGMTAELLKKMRSTGCLSLCYGMESASDAVLKKMNKSFDSGIAEQVIRDTHNAGIVTSINIIIGHPGESAQEFKKTCEFIIRNKEFIDEITNVSTCFLMPETNLIKNIDKFGIYFRKSLKDRLKSFYKKNATSCNYRKFYALPDNSPRMRAMRLRKMLFLISKLNIPHVIVNRVKEDDTGFDKLFQDKKLSIVATASAGLLRVNFDPNMKIAHIYFNNQRLTSDVGINTSFNIGGNWLDSSKGNWQVKAAGNRLFAKIAFQNLPISQDWLIRLKKEALTWEVKTYFHDDITVAQQKFGAVFSDLYNKYSTNGLSCGFPPMDEGWKEVDFLRNSQINLIPHADLPEINLHQEGAKEKAAFIQLQNLPFSFCARMVNFCLIDSVIAEEGEKKYHIFKKGNIENSCLKLILTKT